MKKILIGAGFAAALSWPDAAAAASRKAAKTERRPPAGSGRARRVDEANAATVTGKVASTGDKPTMKNLDMSANPACAKAHSDAAEIGRSGGQRQRHIEECVRLGEIRACRTSTWPAPSGAVTLDQKGCMYEPARDRRHGRTRISRSRTAIRPITTFIRCPRSTRSGTSRSRPERAQDEDASPARKS